MKHRHMKKLITFLFILSTLNFSLKAQEVYFESNDVTETFSDTVSFIIDGGKNYIINEGTRDVTITWEREDIENPEDWKTQVCTVPSVGDGTCYAEIVRMKEEVVPAGGKLGLKLQYTTNNIPGSANTKLKFFVTGDPSINGEAVFKCEMWLTGIEDITADQKSFRTYPNPVINTLTVELKNYQEIRFIEVYNLVGRTVKSAAIENPNGSYTLDLMDLGEGMYFISLLDQNEQMVTTKRFSKVR